VLEANQALCALTSYTRSELVGMTSDRRADLTALVAESRGGSFESRWRRRDGSEVDVEMSASVDPGSSEPLIAFVRDISERKRAELALEESERRYRLLAENSTDVIWTLDVSSQRFTYVSPSVERLRGFTPEEVMAQPVQEALTAGSARAVAENLFRQVAGFEAGDESLRTAVHEISQPRKNGSVVETEIVTTLLSGEPGKVTHILGVTRDITDRKRRDEELRLKEAALAVVRGIAIVASLGDHLREQGVPQMWGFASGRSPRHHRLPTGRTRRARLRRIGPVGGTLDRGPEARRKDGSTFCERPDEPGRGWPVSRSACWRPSST
jgi:PAS domain S-box-containing protein